MTEQAGMRRGRTQHAKHIEDFLNQSAISGRQIIETGLGQAMHFGTEYQKATVSKVLKNKESLFEAPSDNV